MESNILRTFNENFGIKIFAVFFIFIFIMSSSFTVFFINRQSRALNDSLIEEGKLLTNILAYNSRIGVFSENENLLKNQIEGIFQQEQVLEVLLFGPEGDLLSMMEREPNPVESSSGALVSNKDEIFEKIRDSGTTQYFEGGDKLEFWAPVLSKSDFSTQATPFFEETEEPESRKFIIGFAKVTVGKHILNKQIKGLLFMTIFLGIIFLLAGSYIAYFVARRITRPLNRLTEGVNTIRSGGIVEKIHPETKDEIGKLANAFNSMSESLRWREHALKESEAKYRSLFEESRDVIFVMNNDGKFIAANQAAFDLFGYTREEMMDLSIRDLFINRVEMLRLKKQVDKNHFIKDHEVRLRDKDGRIFDCLFTASVRRANGRSILGYQGIIRDITEKKMLEAQLMQAQKMEAIGTLAGGIAHDFNNIIGIIVGNAELSMDDVPEDNPAQANLGEIFKACIRARDLVSQILAFSRQSKQEMKPLRISKVVREALRLLRPSIPTTIEIKKDISKRAGTVLGDQTQISQIILNLCTNAAHAMKEKGGVLGIKLEDVELDDEKSKRYHDLKPGKYVQLTINDTGHGIQPEIMEHIFDPYFTTKKVGEGSGMGLAVVHGIVKGHGGAISIDSEPEKGAVFNILFPVIESNAGEALMEAEKLPGGNERILFVDDENAIVHLGKTMLERLGYHVETRTSPIEALEAVRNRPDAFDLIITDMTMPSMTGLDLAREILKIRGDSSIIVCTGYSEMLNEGIANELGISLAMKPFVSREIAGTIREALDKNRS